jgi:predicted ester cyclase
MSATSDHNKALTVRFFEQVFNQGDLAIIDELIGPDYTFNGVPTTPEATKAWAQSLRARFPDLRFMIETILGEDEKVALRWRMVGTDQQSGHKVTTTGTNILVIVDGKALSNDQGGGDQFTAAAG